MKPVGRIEILVMEDGNVGVAVQGRLQYLTVLGALAHASEVVHSQAAAQAAQAVREAPPGFASAVQAPK